MKFETIFRKMTMLTFQNHCQHVKKVILNIIFCMLKKISQKFFFIFYQLQQTPTWVVYKNSNHLPGFQIKHEKAATTYSKHTAASTYQINIFSMIFSTNVSSFFSQIAANTYLKMIWKKRKQQPPTLKHRLLITIQGFFFSVSYSRGWLLLAKIECVWGQRKFLSQRWSKTIAM